MSLLGSSPLAIFLFIFCSLLFVLILPTKFHINTFGATHFPPYSKSESQNSNQKASKPIQARINHTIMLLDSNPPLLHNYGALLNKPSNKTPQLHENQITEECQLPLIDLAGLKNPDMIRRLECSRAICRASSEWGFFQVVNHGISPELIKKMRREQVKLFSSPFEKKQNAGLLNNSYRFGTPTATHPSQFSWSEAFHIPVSKISDQACYGEFTSLWEVMEEFSAALSSLSKVLAEVLINNLGNQEEALEDICESSSCFLRLNRYPACPFSPEMFGLVPHTDSDFLTILCQDQVGGLQLMKDSKWVAVKPNPDALIVNIGDLFQAWSNDVYKSVEHKVMANEKTERYSIAYFLCPSYDSLIGSCSSRESSIYRKFTFGEYRSQVQEDVKKLGHKIGLPRFLIQEAMEHKHRQPDNEGLRFNHI